MYCTSLVNYIRKIRLYNQYNRKEVHRDDTWWNGWVGEKIGVMKSVGVYRGYGLTCVFT